MSSAELPSRVVSRPVASGEKDLNRQKIVEGRVRWVTEPAPDNKLPDGPMDPIDAHLLIDQELLLDGDPEKNLATFVTTWMGPNVDALIARNLHRNFIDHAEYPQTAEIEQRCIRMLADLFHAPGETIGARTQGSSEAIMLGALAMKWKWRGGAGGAEEEESRTTPPPPEDAH